MSKSLIKLWLFFLTKLSFIIVCMQFYSQYALTSEVLGSLHPLVIIILLFEFIFITWITFSEYNKNK